MLSSDLFVVQVPVLGVQKMGYWYTVNEFVCGLSTVLNTAPVARYLKF